MKLVIEIEFGNAAMLRYSEARAAIKESLHMDGKKPRVGDSGIFRDLNGNKVGRWEVQK